MGSDRPPSPTEDRIEHLAALLTALAGDQNVRVLEALAAALANRYRQEDDGVALDGPDAAGLLGCGLAEAPAPWHGPSSEHLQLCRRIARRAVRGSLADPTGGATAFHTADESPAWARHRYPVAVVGRFLFYGRTSSSQDL